MNLLQLEFDKDESFEDFEFRLLAAIFSVGAVFPAREG